MKTKICLPAILIFICLIQIVFAQKRSETDQKKVLICSDCVDLNNKPISLPKPAYPKAARAVHASGVVGVQILINEDGDVIEAKAVSGHPLLWAASVKAALQAKLKPFIIGKNQVKGYGFIRYKFIDDDLQTSEISKSEVKVQPQTILIGKAINLVKPLFPSNCRCKFSKNSKVIIQFIVDKYGNVESVKGIAGDPLLRSASEAAIRKSKFSVSRVKDVPVKAFGTIVYDFVILRNKWKTLVIKQELKINK